MLPGNFRNWVIIDEIQRVPELLNEVHRLIEGRKARFVLTGSSARKLRGKGINLLGGRALTYQLFPLTAVELGTDFNLKRSVEFGHLPVACTEKEPQPYLESYVKTYLREEVQQEGLTRNLGAFARFLETASLSQTGQLNISEVARDSSVERKVVENYFHILEDLLLAQRLPVFTKRAGRRIVQHPKFYIFDAGVYRTIRPKGPLDGPEEIRGSALETLVYQELRAINSYMRLGYDLYYWRTPTGSEVDFVLYGEKGLIAIEVKSTGRLRNKDFQGLRDFVNDYPIARSYLFYGGNRSHFIHNVQVLPVADAIQQLPSLLNNRQA